MIIDTDTSSIGSLKTLIVEVRIAMVCFFLPGWLPLSHVYSSSQSGILDFSCFSDLYFEWVCNNYGLL